MEYVTEQGKLRDSGDPNNIITETLAGGTQTEIRTDDWMSFYADIFAGQVQYGGRTDLCDFLFPLNWGTQEDFAKAVIAYGAKNGTTVEGYNSNDLANTTIDVKSAGRPWTYQYCTEFGWFQTISKKHPMRSPHLGLEYWPAMCERAFPGLNMDNKPKAWANTIDQGGVSIAEGKIFFANGGEDPWQWATK